MRSVVIIGMPLSGKSTLLRAFSEFLNEGDEHRCPDVHLNEDFLAKLKKWHCVILDEEIEKRAGMRVFEIFIECGEEYFRRLEAFALKELAAEREIIVEAGGGAVTTEASRAAIAEFDAVVYLECDVNTLVKRANQTEVDSRPLLSASDDAAAKISQLYGVRRAYYEALATHIIRAGTVKQILEELIKILFSQK